MNMAMQIKHTWRQRDDGAVRENQVQARSMFHVTGVFDQSNPQVLVKHHPAPVMIAAHQIEFAVQQGNQGFGIFLFAQRQVAQVEDGVSWLDEAIPVLSDQVLPTIRPVAVSPDIGVEEMGISDDPGRITYRVNTLIQVYNLPAADCLSPRPGTRPRPVGLHAPANHVSG